jgi:hypothetical protein
MPATFTYANILHAVGQVLDQLGVKSFAIREEEDGLFIEGFDSEGQLQVQGHYDTASLYDLVNSIENNVEKTSVVKDDGVLRRFLATHERELIGAAR